MTSRLFRFPLAPPPGHPFTGPGGPAYRARGEVRLRVWPDGTGALLTRAEGLRLANNEGGFYQTWLVADLRVPRRLDPLDRERLPRADPQANQPGGLFTLDGQPPRVLGPSASERPNTVWLAVRAGAWGTDETGRQPGARWFLNDFSNWTFWLPEGWGGSPPPLVEAAEGLRDPDAAGTHAVRGLPSGLAFEILTDLFIRRGTVLPEGPLEPGPRLLALMAERIAPLDSDGDGLLGYPDVVGRPGLFLSPLTFQRVVVTRELPSAATVPRGYPSTAAVVMAGWREDGGSGRDGLLPREDGAGETAGEAGKAPDVPGAEAPSPPGEERTPRTEASEGR